MSSVQYTEKSASAVAKAEVMVRPQDAEVKGSRPAPVAVYALVSKAGKCPSIANSRIAVSINQLSE